jgi:hypothetical protein
MKIKRAGLTLAAAAATAFAPFAALAFLALTPMVPVAQACPGASDGIGNDTRAAHDACCADHLMAGQPLPPECNAGPMAPKLRAGAPCTAYPGAGASPACSACIRANPYNSPQVCAGAAAATRPARIAGASFAADDPPVDPNDPCSGVYESYLGNAWCRMKHANDKPPCAIHSKSLNTTKYTNENPCEGVKETD